MWTCLHIPSVSNPTPLSSPTESLNSYEKKIKDIAENGILFACDDGSEKVISRRGKTNKKFLEEVESYLESDFDMEYYGDPT